jgi:hypothetical protein
MGKTAPKKRIEWINVKKKQQQRKKKKKKEKWQPKLKTLQANPALANKYLLEHNYWNDRTRSDFLSLVLATKTPYELFDPRDQRSCDRDDYLDRTLFMAETPERFWEISDIPSPK